MPLDANTPDVQDVQDEFLPRDLRTGATAVMKPGGGLLGRRMARRPGDAHPDRLIRTEVSSRWATETFELACDRTTPLAALLAGRRLAMLEWTGPVRLAVQPARAGHGPLHEQAVRAGQDPRDLRARAGLEPAGLGEDDQRAARTRR